MVECTNPTFIPPTELIGTEMVLECEELTFMDHVEFFWLFSLDWLMW